MNVRTDLRAGQSLTLDPQQLAQWAQGHIQPSKDAAAMACALGEMDAQALTAAVQSGAGSLNPQQFLSLVGTLQGYLQSS